MNSVLQQWLYYIIGLLLVIVGVTIAWHPTFLSFIMGSAVAIYGCYLCILGEKLRQENEIIASPKDSIDIKPDNNSGNTGTSGGEYISTSGGNYNEHIQGDYINIQGNDIHLGEDLSLFIAEIKKILEQLQGKGFGVEDAQKQVVRDLETQTDKNHSVKRKLFRWRKLLGIDVTKRSNASELAERIVSFASKTSCSSNNSISIVEDKYKNLHDLLESERWKEADRETVRLICDVMPKRGYRYIEVDEIPVQDLTTVNQLWTRFSNGRFGFSVQQRVWIKVLEAHYRNRGKGAWIDDSVYFDFIDCVEWSRESDRVYHTDFKYSITAPLGHLPARIMFVDSYYNRSSNYCYLNRIIFNALMDRDYSKASFLYG